MNSPIKLPPLPYPQMPGNDYTAGDMRAYAEQAVREALASAFDARGVKNGDIRSIFLTHGFTVKEGQTDLKPYVYAAAHALRNAVLEEAAQTAYKALFPTNDRSDWTEFAESASFNAKYAAQCIRALQQPQADKCEHTRAYRAWDRQGYACPDCGEFVSDYEIHRRQRAALETAPPKENPNVEGADIQHP